MALIKSFELIKNNLKLTSIPLCVYSGGLDGTYLLKYLRDIGCENVIALTIDIGGDINYRKIQDITTHFGFKSIIEDCSNDFVSDFILPAIKAHGCYLGNYPISASLSRPLIAYQAAKLAKKYNCDLILHTSNSSQNSLRRFNTSIKDLEFSGHYGTPYENISISRELKIKELEKIGFKFSKEDKYSTDINLWCREFEYGDSDNPENFKINNKLFLWTRINNSNKFDNISIEFNAGTPISLNDEHLELKEIIDKLNKLVGHYGLGRYIGLEEIENGFKVQEIREMPAAFLLFDAYRRLESASISSEAIREKINMEQIWVREAIEGRWFGKLRPAAESFINYLSNFISGKINYKISKNKLEFISMKVEKPLYIKDRFEFEKNYNLI